MQRSRRRILAALLASSVSIACAAPSAAQTRAVDPQRDAALRALARRLHLPLVDEAVETFSTQLRRTLPAYFVDAAGQNANLGPQWKRGNASFDEAVRQVDIALANEEARDGPLLKLERDDLLSAVNIPWTRDDIAFVDATLDTPLGHEAERALDAQAARQAIATLRRRVAIGAPGEGIKQAFADLDARAAAQYGDASLMLLAIKGADPAGAQRLQRLIEAVTLLPSDAIGRRVVDRLSRRLLDAAAAQLPNIVGIIGGFRTTP
ncbi:MAG: hypothetical protein ABI277_01465 [Burkholderiaceae bacterium]